MQSRVDGSGVIAPGNRADTSGSQNGKTEWSVRDVATATLITLGIGFAFYLVFRLYMIVFLFFVAVTLAVAIRPLVEWFQRRGIRQEFAVLLILTMLLTVIGGFIWAIAPLMVEQVSVVISQLPDYYSEVRNWLADSNFIILRRLAFALPVVPELPTTEATEEVSALATIAPAWLFLKSASYAIFVTGAILVLTYYWVREGDLITRRLLLLTPQDSREVLRKMLSEMGGTIGGYFRAQAILSVIIGVLSVIAYWLIGMPYAVGLGLVMGVFEAIPIIGPTLGAIPAVLVALTSAPDRVVWLLAVVIVIQVLENNLLVPRIMDQSVGVNAIVTILAIAAFGALFGIVGAILAIPLAAMMQIVVNHILFSVSPIDEPVPSVATGTLERTQVSKLRLQTQELVQDVRKGTRTRTDDGGDDLEMDKMEDMLESIALDLDELLSEVEQPVEQPA